MNIPTQPGQGPAASTDYQSLYAARSDKRTFEQTLAQAQSSSFSLTTAEGDLVTLSDLSQNYQYTQAVGWFTPASSGVNYSSRSTSTEAMGLSVQGDLNEQELADITRLVGELTSIASAFFSGDQETAMTRAMDFGNLDLGSVSSLSASFSRQTVIQTRITSHSPLPAMAALNDLNLKDLYQSLGAGSTKELDYATMLEARWQQILKALDEIKAEGLDGLFASRIPVQPMPPDTVSSPANSPLPARQEAEPANQAAIPTENLAARQMLAQMEQFLGNHPKLTPFAKALSSAAMEKAVARTDQPQPVTARDFAALHNAFRNQLHQWLFAPEPPTPAKPLTA